jgi:hypothetical protein
MKFLIILVLSTVYAFRLPFFSSDSLPSSSKEALKSVLDLVYGLKEKNYIDQKEADGRKDREQRDCLYGIDSLARSISEASETLNTNQERSQHLKEDLQEVQARIADIKLETARIEQMLEDLKQDRIGEYKKYKEYERALNRDIKRLEEWKQGGMNLPEKMMKEMQVLEGTERILTEDERGQVLKMIETLDIKEGLNQEKILIVISSLHSLLTSSLQSYTLSERESLSAFILSKSSLSSSLSSLSTSLSLENQYESQLLFDLSTLESSTSSLRTSLSILLSSLQSSQTQCSHKLNYYFLETQHRTRELRTIEECISTVTKTDPELEDYSNLLASKLSSFSSEETVKNLNIDGESSPDSRINTRDILSEYL